MIVIQHTLAYLPKKLKMVTVKTISEKFNLRIVGDETLLIKSVSSIHAQNIHSISWIKSKKYLNLAKEGAFVVNLKEIQPKEDVTFLMTEQSPKLIFSKIYETFFLKDEKLDFSNFVSIHRENKNIKIGDNVFIGENVKIGDKSLISSNTVINSNTTIGKNSDIKENVSIGCEGLGLEYDSSTKTYVKFPQIGETIIGDDVFIGPNSVIRKGALDNTIIEKGSKIGSLVNIGHNCHIGCNCILTSGITMAGSVKMKNNVFVGVNSSFKNGISIGENAYICMGSVVVNDVLQNSKVLGVPAKPII